MGTRAVVHVDLQPLGIGKDVWIATHWDGDPDSLGKDLVKTIKDEVKRQGSNVHMGDALQVAVWKAAAEHSIDLSTTSGKKEFDKMYGDFAEYQYEVGKKGKVKVRPIGGEWGKQTKIGKWKKLGEVV
jgi:hypothetical protein